MWYSQDVVGKSAGAGAVVWIGTAIRNCGRRGKYVGGLAS